MPCAPRVFALFSFAPRFPVGNFDPFLANRARDPSPPGLLHGEAQSGLGSEKAQCQAMVPTAAPIVLPILYNRTIPRISASLAHSRAQDERDSSQDRDRKH